MNSTHETSKSLGSLKRILSVGALALLMGFSLTGCNSDDDPSYTPPVDEQPTPPGDGDGDGDDLPVIEDKFLGTAPGGSSRLNGTPSG